MDTRKSYNESQRRKLYLANSMADSIEESDLRGLDLLLRHHDADPNFIIPEKIFSPMHMVAAAEDENFAVKALELLFEHGADPNVCGDESITPVHVAASWDHANVLHVLLENGGNPHLKDECGKDSFDYVQENGCIHAEHVLAQYHDTGKLLMRIKNLQVNMPCTVPSLGRRSRIFFRPSTLAGIPDSHANCSSGESVEIVEEVCKHSESQMDASQLFSSSVCESNNEEQEDSVVFLEEVKSHSLSCKEPIVSGDSHLTAGNLADCSHNTCDTVGGDLKPLAANAENCYSNSLSFGVMENENIFLASKNHVVTDMSMQSDNCGVAETRKDTCANDEDCALFCEVNPISKSSKEISGIDPLPEPRHSSSSDSLEPCEKRNAYLSNYKREPRSFSLASFEEHERVLSRESVAGKTLSLRKSLMPKKQIPRIVISDVNDIIHEVSNEDGGLDEENLLASSSQKTFDDKRLLDWINNINDNLIPDIELEKSKSLSDNENNLQLDSASCGTFKSCDSGSGVVGTLNTGAAGSCLHASSSVSSTGTCVSECYLYTDEENGIALLEERWRSNPVLKSEAPQTDQSCSSHSVATTDTEAYDTESLRRELTSQGIVYGPITATTKRVYVKRLGNKRKLRGQLSKEESKFSFELQRSLRDGRNRFFVSLGSKLERQIAEEFSACGGGDRGRRWREGCNKTSFNYLLLDPRITQNLPWRAPELARERVWLIFLKSIFYVGKGKRSRPYSHLYEAVQHWNNQHPTRFMNAKVKQILDIWAEGFGVVCLHIFQNVIPVEAYTREAAMIDALGLDNLSNAKRSEYYGHATKWVSREQRILGVYLLDKAMTIFLAEGERQILPWDLHS